MGMGREDNAVDRGALGAGHLGYRQGSRTYAPCADNKPFHVREDARTRHPLYQNTTHHQEENATAEEDLGTGRQAASSALLPNNIGKYVVHNAGEVTRLGWTEFVRRQRGRGYFASLSLVKHPACRLLIQYKHRSAPVVLMTGEWSEGERLAALKRGPHRSAT